MFYPADQTIEPGEEKEGVLRAAWRWERDVPEGK